ncbi:MAG: phosphatase PAP2 family protein [Caldilineales bacterium]
MEQFLGLQTWGTDLILWIQSFSSTPLDAFFLAVTWLGNAEAYMVVLTLIYWCVNRRWGIRLLVLMMLSSWVNEFVKSLLKLPRPDPARVRQLVEEPTYGLPSNHAQTTGVVLWGYLAVKVQRGWFTVVAVVMALLISLSRLYLGIHFPQDVLAGWLLGGIVLVVWLRYEDRLAARWNGLSTAGKLALSVLGPVALALLLPPGRDGNYPNMFGAVAGGILMGAGFGAVFEARWVQFKVEGSIGQRALRYVVGIALVGLVYAGGRLIPDASPWLLEQSLRTVRYALVSLTAIGLLPWVFVKLKLAESDLNRET